MGQYIPDSVKQLVLEESGYQCAFCGHRDGLNLTHHHLDPKRDGGPATYENLIAICQNCHAKAESGKIDASGGLLLASLGA